MKYLILPLILAVNYLFAFNPQTVSVPSPYSSCVRVTQSGPNGSAFSFYNGCGEKLWINACIEGGFGKTQLEKSARSIDVGGRFTVYPFFDIDARKISWSAHPYQPIIPGVCGKKS